MAKTLAQKLLIKPGMVIALLNAPDGYLDLLGDLPEGVTISHDLANPVDTVQAFVRNQAAIQEVGPPVLAASKPDCLVWFAYPKKSSGVVTDVTRDTGWEPIYAAGWRPVTQISIDEIWSALRMRPADQVKSRR